MKIRKINTKNRKSRYLELDLDSLEALCVPACVINPLGNIIEAKNLAFSNLWKEGYQPSTPTTLFANQIGELIAFTEAIESYGSAQTNDLIPVNNSMQEGLWITQGSEVCTNHGISIVLVLLPVTILNEALGESVANDAIRSAINDRKQFRYLYQQESSMKNFILDAAGEGIFGVDGNGNTTFVNQAARKILGWSEEDLLGQNMHEMIHHHFVDGAPYPEGECNIYKASREGKTQTISSEVFWHRDGHPIPIEYTATPLQIDNEPPGSVVIFRDITSRLARESALREALQEVAKLKERLQKENEYLKNEMREVKNLSTSMVGQSSVMTDVRGQIEVVGPTDATVLITGESGTGKELIAEAIHNTSRRKDNALIKVNCGAIPRELFESEFFGHAKGSFSGAVTNRIGRFELADGGTLFLDEIGELPIELQPKLLRVIQAGEFERIGGTKTQKVDVRIIAATNRDLAAEVNEKRFREDLYFRLNVFPIASPPLRDRPDDIIPLVEYFTMTICAKLALPEPYFDEETLRSIARYPWPGNVRELQNVIERGCILSKGERFIFQSTLNNPEPKKEISKVTFNKDNAPSTLEDIKQLETELILKTLKASKGKVSGKGGAAELLGVKPTTLYSKIKKMERSEDILMAGEPSY